MSEEKIREEMMKIPIKITGLQILLSQVITIQILITIKDLFQRFLA